MLQFVLNYATLIAYLAFTTDVALQIRRVVKRRSALDVSWPGVFIRATGSVIILTKFISMGDIYLIVGQVFFTSAVILYGVFAVSYRSVGATR